MKKKLTKKQIEALLGYEVEIVDKEAKKLGDYNRMETVTIGKRVYVVCGHSNGETVLMTREAYLNDVEFSTRDNDYETSTLRIKVQNLLDELSEEFEFLRSKIYTTPMDISSVNGRTIKKINDFIGIPTLNFVRENFDIFEKFEDWLDNCQWLANSWGDREECMVCSLDNCDLCSPLFEDDLCVRAIITLDSEIIV